MAPIEQRELCLPMAEGELMAGDCVEPRSQTSSSLLARVLERNNLIRALKQVKRNRGAPGIDGLTVEQFPTYLKQYWPMIRQQLLDGTYRPKPVRRVEIPKPDGRSRKLGIPTVLDRFIQQAIAQVLQVDWDEHFHDHSYGFRPGRNAHQAIRQAQTIIRSGHRWAVDCDLDAFIDRVNHDVLMTRLKRQTADDELLGLTNRYLKAGVRIEGKTIASTEGVLAWNTPKSAHGPWRLSASPALYRALPNRYFRDLGLPELAAR